MGNNPCTPSLETINSIFSAAQTNSIVPDITLDETLSNYLSLNSSTALNLQFSALPQRLSPAQLNTLDRNLTRIFGGKAQVSYGGVGVVALALSLLLEVLVNQLKGHTDRNTADPFQRIFGSHGSSSSIASTVAEYLNELPNTANDLNAMADLTELFDQRLKLELIELYHRMTIDRKINTADLKQWLNGAAVHLHMRIHSVRLASVPRGSIESLRLSYSTGLSRLFDFYAAYLRRNVKETPPSTAAGKKPGVLTVEPMKKTRHWVAHSACQSPDIASAVISRILKAQDLQGIEDFFRETGENTESLIQQHNSFQLLRKSNVNPGTV